MARWRPNLGPSTDVIKSIMIWVRFLKIQVEIFNEEILLAMGIKLGSAIKVYETTLPISRGKFERVHLQ